MINKDHLYKIIGDKLSKVREDLSMTQEHVADLVGVTRTSISNIETGKQRPPLSLLYLICEVLKVEVRDIIPTNSQLSDIGSHNLKMHSLLNSESLNDPDLLSVINTTQTKLKQNDSNMKKGENYEQNF